MRTVATIIVFAVLLCGCVTQKQQDVALLQRPVQSSPPCGSGSLLLDRWLPKNEIAEFLDRHRAPLQIHSSITADNTEMALLDIDKDGRDELILRTDNRFFFGVIKHSGKETKFLMQLWGYYVGIPKMLDFDKNGTIDFVWQGGKAWRVRVARTTNNGITMIVDGKGALDFDSERAVLRLLVPCGYSYGSYAHWEGGGGIQHHVPYRFLWSYEREQFELSSSGDASYMLADALWTCFNVKPTDVEKDRYIDYWNWAVCLLCARLQYDRALELARQIPEGNGSAKGVAMPVTDKEKLVERVQELSQVYKPCTSLSHVQGPHDVHEKRWSPK